LDFVVSSCRRVVPAEGGAPQAPWDARGQILYFSVGMSKYKI
jgi:hypothetical protein